MHLILVWGQLGVGLRSVEGWPWGVLGLVYGWAQGQLWVFEDWFEVSLRSVHGWFGFCLRFDQAWLRVRFGARVGLRLA